jgi:cytochrome c biogenesis protein CcdA
MLCVAEPVAVDFFFDLGCESCERIEAELLPKIEERFQSDCIVRTHDIGIETNFLYLLQLEDAIGYTGSERGYLIVNKEFLFGPNPSHEKLLSLIAKLVGRGEDGAAGEVAPLVSTDSSRRANLSEPADDPLVEERFSGFTLSAVVLAGLLDGINPCAISTLVFFMSLLAVSKVRSQQLVLLGISFCLASFLTYLALGFGFLRVLHLFSGFKTIRSMVEWGLVAILFVLAALSFRDAIHFQQSGQSRDVTLQLSTGMKKRIHTVLRRGLKNEHLVWGGLFMGMMVTALESVCTGQVYVPTLVLILKNNALAESRAWLYLLAYNAMFIVPLVLTFIAVTFGLRAETLLTWSRKNVVFSKTLLTFFFILMALLIIRL